MSRHRSNRFLGVEGFSLWSRVLCNTVLSLHDIKMQASSGSTAPVELADAINDMY